ncbi:MAG TPA: YbaB/EbfC family nucleoid-associated protein [Micromonospora sp.]
MPGRGYGDDTDFDSALRWVDEWESNIAEQAARAQALSHRIATLTATATSPDGLVTVTVDSAGGLRELRLDEAIRRRPAQDIAAQILSVTQLAMRRLVEQVSHATEETLGRDTPAGRAIIESYEKRLRPPNATV